MTQPFDYVVWKHADDDARRLERDEFLRIPLPVRVRALLREEFRFFEDDEELPVKTALDRMARSAQER